MWSFLMRTLLIPVLALSMAACGKNDQADNNQNMADSLTADSIVSNDVTAIDAVTGDAANMAADVDMNFGDLDLPEGNASSDGSSKKPERPAPRATAKPAPKSNSVANATANAE
jgi:hypothetical protein